MFSKKDIEKARMNIPTRYTPIPKISLGARLEKHAKRLSGRK